MSNEIVREIRKGGGGFKCRVLLVTNSFAIVECNGDEAVIFLEFTPAKVIAEGRQYPEFSNENDRRPEQGDEIIAFVETYEENGAKVCAVSVWGYFDQLDTVARAIEAREIGRPDHMLRRQPRRGMRQHVAAAS